MMCADCAGTGEVCMDCRAPVDDCCCEDDSFVDSETDVCENCYGSGEEPEEVSEDEL